MVVTRGQALASSQYINSFLLRLPLEVQIEIYTLVLRGQRIHLLYPRERKSLHHLNAKNDSKSFVIYDAFDITSRLAERSRTKKIVGIALLETCRQIYAEAVGILYSSNVISVNRWDWGATTAIPNLIVPQPRLREIRRLEVDWRFEELPTEAEMADESHSKDRHITWTTHWRTIAREMPRLRVLFVRIGFREPWEYHLNTGCEKMNPVWQAGDEMHWAAPMLQVMNLDTCKILMKTAHATPFILLDDLGASLCTPEPYMCVQRPLDGYPQTEDGWIDMVV